MADRVTSRQGSFCDKGMAPFKEEATGVPCRALLFVI